MGKERALVYEGGDIMSFGSNLARQYEYDEFIKRGIPVDVYNPVMNKSINDKSNVTEEENNHLAEKITEADIARLWKSDSVIMCPEQSAIGSLCETGCLFGWKYMTDKFLEQLADAEKNGKTAEETLKELKDEIIRMNDKHDFFHYFDIRTNHLNEKDWRRSFSINQLLYGMILYCSDKEDGFYTFNEIMDKMEDLYKNDSICEEFEELDGEDKGSHILTVKFTSSLSIAVNNDHNNTTINLPVNQNIRAFFNKYFASCNVTGKMYLFVVHTVQNGDKIEEYIPVKIHNGTAPGYVTNPFTVKE